MTFVNRESFIEELQYILDHCFILLVTFQPIPLLYHLLYTHSDGLLPTRLLYKSIAACLFHQLRYSYHCLAGCKSLVKEMKAICR